jgi:hypothetical protein
VSGWRQGEEDGEIRKSKTSIQRRLESAVGDCFQQLTGISNRYALSIRKRAEAIGNSPGASKDSLFGRIGKEGAAFPAASVPCLHFIVIITEPR